MERSDKWVAFLINVLWPQWRNKQQPFFSEAVLQVMNQIYATYCSNTCFVPSQTLIISIRQFILNIDYQL